MVPRCPLAGVTVSILAAGVKDQAFVRDTTAPVSALLTLLLRCWLCVLRAYPLLNLQKLLDLLFRPD